MAKSAQQFEQMVRRGRSAPAPSSPAAGFLSWLQNRAVRETVESVVIAIVLAFLFRTFVAEPFVIPTGSMAPTLQGRHQNITCPICEFPYRAGASGELNNGFRSGNNFAAVCPQCGFPAATHAELARDAEKDRPQSSPFPDLSFELGEEVSSSGGDRILVSKSAYEFDEPQRWDVFVFHFPGDASKNYIKRLVGLPGEILRIKHGDVFRSEDMTADNKTPSSEFSILHKPADAVIKMRQLVYDNDFAAAPNVVKYMTDRYWPTRWSSTTNGWQSQDGTKSFSVTAGQQPSWLRYRHFVAGMDDWIRLADNNPAADGELPPPPRAQLITDGYAYNQSRLATRQPRFWAFKAPIPDTLGMNWVGDLVVECQLQSEAAQGKAILELVEGGVRFQCELDLAAGTASLQILDLQGNRVGFTPGEDGTANQQPQANTSVQGIGSHQVAFANFDDQLHLWVDGEAVTFDLPTTYPRLGNTKPQDLPAASDLSPVGIAAVGANLKVDHIKLFRDVYYVATDGQSRVYCDLGLDSRLFDYLNLAGRRPDGSLADLFRNRAKYFSTPDEWKNDFDNKNQRTFRLQAFADDRFEDQFFALGDNSPHSQDSRLWSEHRGDIGPYVERKLIIGRAMVIYWPISNWQFIQ